MIGPWTARLVAGTKELQAAVAARDRPRVVAGLDDVSFWIGRLTCDALAASEDAPENESVLRKAVAATMKARRVIQQARRFLVAK